MPFRGFESIRQPELPISLKNDLRELERWLRTVDDSLAALRVGEPLSKTIERINSSNVGPHAITHSTGGSDPIDPYDFTWKGVHNFSLRSGQSAVPVTITAPDDQTLDIFQIKDSVFDPSSIDDLEVWYKFDTIGASDKQELAEGFVFTDFSGNGNHGEVDGSTTPGMRARTNFQNSLTVLETIADDGSRLGNWILVNDGNHPVIATTGDPAWEGFFVVRRAGTDVGTGDDIVFMRTRSSAEDGNSRNFDIAMASGGASDFGSINYVGATAAPLSTVSTAKDTWAVHNLSRNGSGVHKYTIDGTDTTDGTPTAIGSNFVLRTLLAKEGLDDGFSGQVGEVLIFTRQLTSTEREQITNYLKSKWSIGTATGSGVGQTLVVVDNLGRMGIGGGLDPATRLHIKDTVTQLRIEYDASNYTEITNSPRADARGNTLITAIGTNRVLTIPNANESGFAYTAFGDDADSTILDTIAGIIRVRGSIGGAQIGLYGDANINAAFSMRGDADGDQWTLFTDRANDGQLTFKQHAGPAGARDVNILTLRDTGSAGEAKFWYDASNYATLTIPSDGEVQFNVQGGDPNYRFRSADVTIVRLIAPNIISGPGVPPDDSTPESSGLEFYAFNADGPMGAINPAFVFDHVSGANTGNLMLFKEASSAVAAIKKTGTIMGFGLGIGLGTTAATAPGAKAEIRFTSEQLRLSYNSTNRMSITVGSAGSTTFALTGTTPEFTFSQKANFTNGIGLSTSGVITSAEVDAGGQPAFKLEATATRSTDPHFELVNSADDKRMMQASAVGEFGFGNQSAGSGNLFQAGWTLAFIAQSQTYSKGAIHGFVEANSGISSSTPLTAITSSISIRNATNAGSYDLFGGKSVFYCNQQLAAFAGKEAYGHFTSALGSGFAAANSATVNRTFNAANNSLRGAWDRVAHYGASYSSIGDNQSSTDDPATATSVYAPIQGSTIDKADGTGYQWGLETNTFNARRSPPPPGAAFDDRGATHSAALFASHPNERNTNQGHICFGDDNASNAARAAVGGYAASAGGPAAQIGYAYFDDGSNNEPGLYEHLGNNGYRKLLNLDEETGISATNPPAQGSSPLTRQLNEVGTVANVSDNVTLPAAQAGRWCTVMNNGANALRIYPATGDDLGAGVNAFMSTDLAAGDMAIFMAYDSTNWRGFRATMIN